MRVLCLIVLSFLFNPSAFALVDMRNANYSESWVDLEMPTVGFNLKVQRTYNSRSIHNGIFGFGWCSDLETKLTVTPQKTIKIQECGAGAEVEFSVGGKGVESIEPVIQSIMAEVRKRNKSLDKKYFENLEGEIRKDSLLRDEFIRQLNLKGQAQSGAKYFAIGRTNETVMISGASYTRSMPNGITQVFDEDGVLVEQRDQNGGVLKFQYATGKLTKITEGSGSSLQFRIPAGKKYVEEITGPKGLKVTYTHVGEKLTKVKNAWGNLYTYDYDDLYNLTKIGYPDGKGITITYDKDKDWVMTFKDRDGCMETYKYAADKSEPLNNYSSEVTKTCGKEVTNKSAYEFWHKVKADGTRYLAKSRAEVNGKVSETEYHPDHGRPVRHLQNGHMANYIYYPDGLLKTKTEAGREINYKYDTSCKKPSEVATRIFASASPAVGRKAASDSAKLVTTTFKYEMPSCNLMSAENSDGQFAKLTHDRRGRIKRIEDQSKKVVNITYEERYGKPLIVERPGVGRIKFKYKANGDADGVESDDEPLVAVQIANMFSNLLEIIGPGTTDSAI